MATTPHCRTCGSPLSETLSSPDEWLCSVCEVHRAASEVDWREPAVTQAAVDRHRGLYTSTGELRHLTPATGRRR